MLIEYVASCCTLTSHIYLYDWKTLLQDEQVAYILSLPSVRICLYLIWFENPTKITFKSIHNHWKPQNYVGLSLRNINQLLHNQFSLWLRFSYLCLRTFIKGFNRFQLQVICKFKVIGLDIYHIAIKIYQLSFPLNTLINQLNGILCNKRLYKDIK